MSAWLKPLLAGVALTLLLAMSLLLAAYLVLRQVLAELPRLPDDPAELGYRPGTEIYAASGERIYTFNQSRQWVSLGEISPHAIQALLATEDEHFFRHRGIDLEAVAAALWENLRHGFGTRGGSTLTQQLVKRLFFSPEKTIERKLSEMLLALQLETLYERAYPGTSPQGYPAYKDRLLELYINTVFYGANAYGIHDAAAIFFGRHPSHLSLPQAALLMGLINAPTAYNPLQRPERATLRLQHVLARMQEVGLLAPEERDALTGVRAEELVDPHRSPLNPTPYWVEAIKAETVRRWGAEVLRYGSLRIYTTLDMNLQRAAEKAVADSLAALDERMGFKPYARASAEERASFVQAALVCLDPHTGQVRAMVGGRDIFVSYYNRALTARRQPGSGFKPVAYLAALEEGIVSPLSLFVDEPRAYEDNDRIWMPRNYGDRYLGPTTVAWALIHSANSTAVQITANVGPAKVVDMAKKLGFAEEIGPYMSIALGVDEVTVLEMASAFGALAASGLRVEPTLVERIAGPTGAELFAHEPAIVQVVSPELAGQMVELLRQAVERGTGRRVRASGFSRPAAGKTGTTNDNTDAWFTGFTPDLVASVWVGFDDRKKHKLQDRQGRQITGGSGAAPIWAAFMSAATEGTPVSEFSLPPGLRRLEVDPHTGIPPEHVPAAETAPIPVVLRHHERPNTPGDVQAFLEQYRRARPDSVLETLWDGEEPD